MLSTDLRWQEIHTAGELPKLHEKRARALSPSAIQCDLRQPFVLWLMLHQLTFGQWGRIEFRARTKELLSNVVFGRY